MFLAIVVDLAVIHSKINSLGIKSGVERITDERRVFIRTFDVPIQLLDTRDAAGWVSAKLGRARNWMHKDPATGNRFLRGLFDRISDFLTKILPTVEVVALRMLSLIATIPIIAICVLVAGFDGWVRREVRKAGAGIESARIYHFAKRSINPVFLWVCLMYLIVPITLDVRWAYGILVVVVPLLVGITISRFKKYV